MMIPLMSRGRLTTKQAGMVLLCAVCIAIQAFAGGCVTSDQVGTSIKHDATGQTVTGSTNSTRTLLERPGTPILKADGSVAAIPTDVTLLDNFPGPKTMVRDGNLLIDKNGQVTREYTIRMAGGTSVTVSAGDDTTATGIDADLVKGTVKIASLGQSSSAPLTALATIEQELTKRVQALTPAQLAAIQDKNAAYVAEVSKISDSVGSIAAQALAAMFPPAAAASAVTKAAAAAAAAAPSTPVPATTTPAPAKSP